MTNTQRRWWGVVDAACRYVALRPMLYPRRQLAGWSVTGVISATQTFTPGRSNA